MSTIQMYPFSPQIPRAKIHISTIRAANLSNPGWDLYGLPIPHPHCCWHHPGIPQDYCLLPQQLQHCIPCQNKSSGQTLVRLPPEMVVIYCKSVKESPAKKWPCKEKQRVKYFQPMLTRCLVISLHSTHWQEWTSYFMSTRNWQK